MTELFLRTGQSFSVPVIVADNFLRLASHEQLKILLYVLCHADAPISTEDICRVCGVTQEDVTAAVVFWQNANVLGVGNGNVPAVSISPAVSAPAPAAPAPEPQAAPKPEEPAVPEPLPAVSGTAKAKVKQFSDSIRFNITPSMIAERLQNQKIRELFEFVEQLAGDLKPSIQQSLIWMHDYLGIQPDNIAMLLAYCKEIGKFEVPYWQTIAADWQEREINTHEQVQQEINRLMDNRTYVGRVRRMLEMQRTPTDNQQEFIDRWQAMGFSPEVIREASFATRDNTDDRMSFPYMDRVLTDWHTRGITTVEAAKAAAIEYKAQNKNKPKKKKAGGPDAGTSTADGTASFDISDFEKLANQF